MKMNKITSLFLCVLLLPIVCIYAVGELKEYAVGEWKKELKWDWPTINTDDVEYPNGFLWGTGTSAYQVEGNCTDNDYYPYEGSTKTMPEMAGLACDHWNRYKEDIQLMKKLGFKAYRFSVEWSKIEPQEGDFNEEALQHYADVCDELIKNDIQPVVGFHHYTNPRWFTENMDGFEKEDNIGYFVRFCTKVFEKLQNKVKMWITFNSPDAYAIKGYQQGMTPPFKKDMHLAVTVLKNMFEAHVQAYQACKSILPDPKTHQIGIMKNVFQLEQSGKLSNIAYHCARRMKDDCFYEFFRSGVFNVRLPFWGLSHALCEAHVPFPLRANVYHENYDAPKCIDFIGISYYSHGYLHNFSVKNDTTRIPTKNERYVIYAEGLYRAIQEVSECLAKPCGIPIYITENGIAACDNDQRELFFRQYLYAMSRAINDGYDVRGYFFWSLMDNYEWGTYKKRYGLYHVDFDTQKRTLKGGTDHFINVVNGRKAGAGLKTLLN